MAVPWKARPNFLWIYLILSPTGVMLQQQLQLEPMNTTVLQGSDVQFRATVEGKWSVMTWTVGGILVLTILPGTNISSSPEQFSAFFCSSIDTSCVDFNIRNVTRKESGPIICTVQGLQGSKTSQLNVQESGTVSIQGGNITVDQDQHVEFRCITTAWFPEPTITWTRNGQLVESSLYNTSSTTEGGFFNSTSVLQFQALRDTTVECLATVQTLMKPQSSSVYLVVVPKARDWTVLIAVVVSIGGCALLVLLIIGIIFCYKRRKEKTSYQEEMSKRVKTQGQVNTGYVTEDQTSDSPSELSDSGFHQGNGSNIVKMPHVKNEQAANASNDASNTEYLSDCKKHRHATIV